MVAKSFQALKQVGEPYTKNGKQYVLLYNEKTGKQREARWYTEEEYAKIYGEEVAATPPKKSVKSQKQVLGFEKGYITIFKGDTYANLEWFQDSIARYHKVWGWYIISTLSLPTDIPEGITPIRLMWESVGKDNGSLKDDSEIQAVIEDLLFEPSNSEYVGEIGQRLDLTLTVVSARKITGYYGESTVHYMEDECGNQYLWNTAAKNWEAGEVKHIKGTIKDHKVIKNVKTTILTRCNETK